MFPATVYLVCTVFTVLQNRSRHASLLYQWEQRDKEGSQMLGTARQRLHQLSRGSSCPRFGELASVEATGLERTKELNEAMARIQRIIFSGPFNPQLLLFLWNVPDSIADE